MSEEKSGDHKYSQQVVLNFDLILLFTHFLPYTVAYSGCSEPRVGNHCSVKLQQQIERSVKKTGKS